MKKEFVRQVVVYGDHFKEFRKTFLTLIMMLDVIPSKFLKAVKNVKGLYEIRTEYEDNRFHKKTQRLPAKELSKAVSIMNDYFKQKKR